MVKMYEENCKEKAFSGKAFSKKNSRGSKKKAEKREAMERPMELANAKAANAKAPPKLGSEFVRESKSLISLSRRTNEGACRITLQAGKRRRFRIDTGLEFFNHMLETIAWRACINTDAEFRCTNYRLTHVITEDTGIALGKAFRKMLDLNAAAGVNGSGSGTCAIDEAMAIACVSFEGRSNSYIDTKESPGASAGKVEDMLSQDIPEFFQGFAQGAGATVNIKTLAGDNPHHTWEAVFRAFGEALKACFERNDWRKGSTVGVKGTME